MASLPYFTQYYKTRRSSRVNARGTFPPSAPEGGRGYPLPRWVHSISWMGYPLSRLGMGYPPHHKLDGVPSHPDLGRGYPPPHQLYGVPPHHQLDGVPPHPDLGRGYPLIRWLGYPPPRCGLTHKLKLLPSLILRMRAVMMSLFKQII